MPTILASNEALSKTKNDILIVPMFENRWDEPKIKELDKTLSGNISELIKNQDFRAQAKEIVTLFPWKSLASPRLVLVGLGKREEYNLEKLRLAMAAVAPVLQKHHIKNAAVFLPKTEAKIGNTDQIAQAATEGLLLSLYKFSVYQKPDPKNTPVQLETIKFVLPSLPDRTRVLKGAERGVVISRAVNYARDLANHPGNVMTPQTLADEAVDLAKKLKLKYKILEKADAEKLGMQAFLAVSQGSVLPPKFIVLEYRGLPRRSGAKADSPVVLVGKGVTFDSGGISIKPGKGMEEMKFDMCGAATVLGTLKAAAELRLPQNLIGIIPATENLPSGSAVKPGDVVRASNGKTIEVLNTDAEGRMILSDALVYATRYQPKLVIDYATLTGACVVALGTDYTGAFATDEKLINRIRLAGETSGEKIWPLPLAPEYKEDIKSGVADIKNIGTEGKGAGTITAALFLQEFVSYPWIHLDIAGTAWTMSGKTYHPRGATGVGVRLTLEFLK